MTTPENWEDYTGDQERDEELVQDVELFDTEQFQQVTVAYQEAVYDLLNQRWYANIENLVGGWCVTNVDKAASEIDYRIGDVLLADCVNEDIAQHIVELHNATLGDDDS